MALKAGSRLGPYEIVSAIGAGGMGEVYLAVDSRLERRVALKVLPELFANDPERLARFAREAKTLAALNHPHIAQIHGLEHEGGVQALVMELVEGEELAQRIARGPIPSDDALLIARQIADALEAAHDQGIIHRDLKPANVKIRPDGTVKVLDFGLAKLTDPAATGTASSGGMMQSPTITSPATMMGVIMGTAAYMSPEQARGKPADRRSDIWAFGCVLYEMLTGKRPFGGDDISLTLAAVLKEDVDFAALPADTPSSIRRLLRRCLEKDPRRRLSSMSDARLDLDEMEDPAARTVAPPTRVKRLALWLLAAGLAGAAISATALYIATARARSAANRSAARLSVLAPAGNTFAFDSAELALSPDGTMLAFTTGATANSTKLWIRPLAALEPRPVPGGDGGRQPFWSPDGRELGFFTDDSLKKVVLATGQVQILGPAGDARGGTWNRDGVIVFAPSGNGPLFRISANGGDATPVTTLDTAAGETGHRFPSFLPDGRHFMFAAIPPKSGNSLFQIFIAPLDGDARQPLLLAETVPAYADPGYLLYSRKHELVAQPFDARSRQLSGESRSLGDSLSSINGLWTAAHGLSASATGALAYLGGPPINTKLVWLDRSAREQETVDVPDGRYLFGTLSAISPDGRRAVVTRVLSPLDHDIWVIDLERTGATRLTFGGAQNMAPAWSHDGQRLLYASDATGPRNLFVKPANGATPAVAVYESPDMFKDPTGWSPDGKFVVFQLLHPQTNYDIFIATVADRTAKPYLQTPFNEAGGTISPDGKWMAYSSNESGRFEIYVQSFPVPGNRHKVTSNGSGQAPPIWRADGKALAMVDTDGRHLLVAETRIGAEFSSGAPRVLTAIPKNHTGIALTPDFQRVLAALPADETVTSSITIVTDWLSALKKN